MIQDIKSEALYFETVAQDSTLDAPIQNIIEEKMYIPLIFETVAQDSTLNAPVRNIIEKVEEEIKVFASLNKVSKNKIPYQKSYLALKPHPENPHRRALLQYEENITNKSIIICQVLLTERKFYHFKNCLEFNKYRLQVPDEEFFNEVIFEHKDQKPYFDIDGEGLSQEDGKELLRQLLLGILKTHDKIQITDIMIFNSHRSNKVSYHIIIDRWVVPNAKQNEAFFNLVKQHVDSKFYIYFDKLYKGIQNLRVYNSMKYENMIRKKLDPESKWISGFDDGSINEAIILAGSLITHACYCKYLPEYKVEEKTIDGSSIDGDTELIMNMTKEYFTANNMDFSFEYVRTLKSLIELKSTGSWNCITCNRNHDSISPFIFVKGENKNIYFSCRRSEKYLYIGRLYNLAIPKIAPKAKKVRSNYMPKALYFSVTEAEVDDTKVIVEKYNERWCRPINSDHKLHVIKSSTKTGKTKSLTGFLKEKQKLKFLSLSSRRSYALSMTQRYIEDGLNCDCYLDRKDHKGKNLVISPESIHSIKEGYDIIVIDEVQSFLHEMNSKYHGIRLHENIKTLEGIMKNAKYIICLDAVITQGVFKLLENTCKDEIIHYSINEYKNSKDLKVYDHVDDYIMFQLIIDHLNAGKNIQIISGSESLVINYIEPILKSLGILEGKTGYMFHHSKGDDQQEVIKNVNVEWSGCRVVIYTSTIGPGIDYTQSHFHVRFSFFNSMTNRVDEYNQMRIRVRNLIDNVEFTSFKTRIENELSRYLTHDSIRQRYDKFLNNSSEAANEILKGYEECKVRYVVHSSDSLLWKYEENMWTWNKIECERQSNISKCWFYPWMVKCYRDSGAIFEPLGLEYINKYEIGAKKWKAWMKDMKAKAKDVLIGKVESVDTKTQDIIELTRRIQDGNATEMDKIAVKKSNITCKLLEGVELSGEQFVLYEKYFKQLDNAKIETEFSYLSVLARDLYFSKYNIIPRPDILKYIAIGQICEKLSIPGFTQVKNTMDRETLIYSQTIHQNFEWFSLMHSRVSKEFSYKELFKLRSEPIVDYRGSTTMINSIFTSWSCTKLIKLKENMVKGVNYIVYRLGEATENFDELFYLLSNKNNYGIHQMIMPNQATTSTNIIENGNLMTIEEIKPTSTYEDIKMTDSSSIINNHVSERKNEMINMNSFKNIDIKLADNDIRMYYKYEGMTLKQFQDNNMIILKDGIYQYTDAGLWAKQNDDLRTLNLINQGILFRYDNPQDPIHSGVYYTNNAKNYKEVQGVSVTGLKLIQ